MGGKGSGRTSNKQYGDYTLYSKGRYNLLSSKRFKSFSYKQGNNKFYGIKDKFTGQTYKRIDETAFNYILRRFAKEDEEKILSRMNIYTKEGLAQRSETALGNIVSALNQVYDLDAVFIINGKEYTLEKIIKAMRKLNYNQKWIDFSLKYSDLIDSFFIAYRAEMAKAPKEGAGVEFGNNFERETSEQDDTAIDTYQKMEEMVKDIVTTFKIK